MNKTKPKPLTDDMCLCQWPTGKLLGVGKSTGVSTSPSTPATDHCGINYYEDLGPMEFVDLNQIECIVRCIKDHGKWSITDQSRLL